jgi:hypothetical protein
MSDRHFNDRFIPVSKWNNYYSWPPIGGLRHLIFHAETNGFKHVIKRIGRRVLIDRLAYERWIETHNESGEIPS